MGTMVDMWGASAHCEICNEEADEATLEDLGDLMACPACIEYAFFRAQVPDERTHKQVVRATAPEAMGCGKRIEPALDRDADDD